MMTLRCRYDADMALENVSLCRSDAAMPHMCHYADYYAGVKRQPQIFVSQDLRYLEHAYHHI